MLVLSLFRLNQDFVLNERKNDENKENYNDVSGASLYWIIAW